MAEEFLSVIASIMFERGSVKFEGKMQIECKSAAKRFIIGDLIRLWRRIPSTVGAGRASTQLIAKRKRTKLSKNDDLGRALSELL